VNIIVETLSYFSSIDRIGPMKMDVARPEKAESLPLVAVMAGFHGSRANVRTTIERLAQKGLFAVGIDMRGRSGAPGQPDAGGAEIYDIVDALNSVCAAYPRAIDKDTWHILGYSGGGGNVFSAVTKFPDRFVIAVSFFGIADYGMWYKITTSKECIQSMNCWIGGSPEEFPDRYRARSSLEAAGNVQGTQVHLFWDEEELICPEPMNSQFKQEVGKQSGGTGGVYLHQSRKIDPYRWFHGYPDDQPSLIHAEDIFVPLMIKQKGPLAFPLQGKLAVPGFVSTPGFEYWIEDGKNSFGWIEYQANQSGKIRIKKL
jgi:pimeloyl-ACP methyl ester carboxylesterase